MKDSHGGLYVVTSWNVENVLLKQKSYMVTDLQSNKSAVELMLNFSV